MTPRRAPPNGTRGGPPTSRRRRRAAPPAAGSVVDLVPARIVRALDGRQRYTYVQPRVVAGAALRGAGSGWCIVSPNCSRNIDPAGGEIPIAWLEPDTATPGRWHLHAFDHGAQQWQCQARGLPLVDALAELQHDPQRRYWP